MWATLLVTSAFNIEYPRQVKTYDISVKMATKWLKNYPSVGKHIKERY